MPIKKNPLVAFSFAAHDSFGLELMSDFIDYAFLRLIKEKTKSTKYTIDVSIHMEAHPAYAESPFKTLAVTAAVFAPMLRYRTKPSRANNAS